MTKYNLWCLVVLGLAASCWGMGLDMVPNNQAAEEDSLEEEGRIILLGSTTGLGLNLTQLAALAAIAASALLSLLGLCALGLLLWALLSQQSNDCYGSSCYGYSSGHSSYRRSFDSLDWEKVSILDWITIGQEAWTKFDPADLECQKRVICELHQNKDKYGPMAQMITSYFSYLEYAEVLSLPEEINSLVQEYLDAADRGRTLHKDCGDIFNGCDFSLKHIMDKYYKGSEPQSPNAIAN